MRNNLLYQYREPAYANVSSSATIALAFYRTGVLDSATEEERHLLQLKEEFERWANIYPKFAARRSSWRSWTLKITK
jgi:hypothetical protein